MQRLRSVASDLYVRRAFLDLVHQMLDEHNFFPSLGGSNYFCLCCAERWHRLCPAGMAHSKVTPFQTILEPLVDFGLAQLESVQTTSKCELSALVL
jgi:uncharacterized protein (DUF2237 family)